MDWGDVPGWLAGVAGLAGCVTGGIGLWRAGRAGDIAKRGNEIAKAANKLAEDANQLAKSANRTSAESNTIAREANSIAVQANLLAEEANTLTKGSHARETERHDVRWEGDWEQLGRYVLVNKGDSEAHHVVAVVTVDD